MAEWRKGGENGRKPTKPKRPAGFDLLWTSECLPWPSVHVRALLDAPLVNGRSAKDKEGGFPVLRLTALKSGKIDLRESKDGDWSEEDAQPFLVKRGDIFISRGNGSKKLVGIGGRVLHEPMPVAFPDTMIRVLPDMSAVRPEYFLLAWNSWTVRQQIENAARTTAGIYKINQGHVCGFVLPFPSLAEQSEIVRILDERLEAVDTLQAEIETALVRADALRQSILKKAFSRPTRPPGSGRRTCGCASCPHPRRPQGDSTKKPLRRARRRASTPFRHDSRPAHHIDSLLRRRTIESERVEYKAGWNPESVLRTLGAFANDFHNLGGGYVVLGVEERDGRPYCRRRAWTRDAIDGIQKEMLNLGNRRHSAPVPSVDGSPTRSTARRSSCCTRPAAKRGRTGRESVSQRAAVNGPITSASTAARTGRGGEDERELLGLAAPVPFDDRYHQNASLDDLSFRLIQQHLQDVGSDLLLEVAERFWNFPVAAIEEALGNAIYHRSYEEREPVEVRITPEELLVLSFPGADRSIRMEDLQQGRAVSRRYRNRRIGEFLKELDLAEGRSTGVPKILRAMHNNGSPVPRFETDDGRTWFLVRLPAHEEFSRSEEWGGAEQHAGQDAAQDKLLKREERESPTEQDTEQVTEQVGLLVLALTGEMRRLELQNLLRIAHRPHFLETYLIPPSKPASSK